MGNVTESVSTFNSFLRTILMAIVLGALGYGGFLGYVYLIKPRLDEQRAADQELEQARQQLDEVGRELTAYKTRVNEQDRVIVAQRSELAEQQVRIDDLSEQNERLELARRLLKVDHRLARIKVINVGINTETNQPFSVVEFAEVDEDGTVLGEATRYQLNGDDIRLDSWIVTFDDKYVEEADLIRGTSLCVFKSIYGNIDGPQNAHSIEDDETRPVAYSRGTEMSEFERKIWADFWEISTNPDRAQELGIRANHGQVNYVKAVPGATYQVELRASAGLSIRRIDTPAPADGGPAAASGDTGATSGDTGAGSEGSGNDGGSE